MNEDSRRRIGAGVSATVATDRRWSPRRFIEVGVALFENGKLKGKGISQNIGLEGLFVRMTGPVESEGVYLDLELSLVGGRAEEVLRVPAVVVHRNQRGMGVTFVAFNQELFRTFDAMLNRPALRGTLVEVEGSPDVRPGSSS